MSIRLQLRLGIGHVDNIGHAHGLPDILACVSAIVLRPYCHCRYTKRVFPLPRADEHLVPGLAFDMTPGRAGRPLQVRGRGWLGRGWRTVAYASYRKVFVSIVCAWSWSLSLYLIDSSGLYDLPGDLVREMFGCGAIICRWRRAHQDKGHGHTWRHTWQKWASAD